MKKNKCSRRDVERNQILANYLDSESFLRTVCLFYSNDQQMVEIIDQSRSLTFLVSVIDHERETIE